MSKNIKDSNKFTHHADMVWEDDTGKPLGSFCRLPGQALPTLSGCGC